MNTVGMNSNGISAFIPVFVLEILQFKKIKVMMDEIKHEEKIRTKNKNKK